MREHTEQILRITCLLLAALLLLQLVKVALRLNPLGGVTIPALPTLASDTNAPATAKGTNSAAAQTVSGNGTNQVRAGSATNFPGAKPVGANGTNSLSLESTSTHSATTVGTNVAATAQTNLTSTNFVTTAAPAVSNSPAESRVVAASENASTNSDASRSNTVPERVDSAIGTNASALAASSPGPTNSLSSQLGTNQAGLAPVSGPNLSLSATNAGTNLAALAKPEKSGSHPPAAPGFAMPGNNFGPPGMGGGPAPELPPEIRARVDRIYESEILGPVVRPLPMALMGIAGNFAFLRSPSGQTGLVKEGDSLGEIKLLRIGINRVVVEQDGQKRELTIFNGYGGESLLPKEIETPK